MTPERRRYALEVGPYMPEGVPLDLMGSIWEAIGQTAEEAGYRAFFQEETGLGVMWFERQDATSYDVIADG